MIFSTPKPGSNAAAIGAMGVCALAGTVLSDNQYVRLSCTAISITTLLFGCAISNIEFGSKDFAESINKITSKICDKICNRQSEAQPSVS
jgi:hypothetical protein